MKQKVYLQYGCGPYDAPAEWVNFDASPMIPLQRIPIAGKILQQKRGISFKGNIRHGNIAKGLPEYEGVCDAVFCSHVVEHLSYEEFHIAHRNTFALPRGGGCFDW
jgi:hypothetical protein